MIHTGLVRHRLIAALQLILNFVSNLMTVYLAYLLYFVLDDFCVVCVSIYVVNAGNLLWSWKRFESLKPSTDGITKRRNIIKSD